MEAEVLITVKKKVNVKYLLVEVHPHFYEDSFVNGKPDSHENPQMPCVTNNKWIIKIDLDNGQIMNWDGMTMAEIHYKVCDGGIYTLLDSTGTVIHSYRGYVPDILGQDRESFGDYIELTIDKDGFIKNWKVSQKDIVEVLQNK